MARIIYSAKDIYEQEFSVAVRGFNKKEVDDFLDNVISDYDTYAALVKELREENARLKEELKLAQERPVAEPVRVEPSPAPRQTSPIVDELRQQSTGSVTNFDILRRLNRLEKEVFGRQIMESEL